MRWVAGTIYAVLVSFVWATAGAGPGTFMLVTVVLLSAMFWLASSSSQAFSGWARLLYHRRRLPSSQSPS